MRLGFCGSREGMTHAQKMYCITYISTLAPTWAGHGDCYGADVDFHRICQAQGIDIHIFPSWLKSRAHCDGFALCDPEKGPLERDRDIVIWADKMLATPKGEEEIRSGTWSTVRYSKRMGKIVTIIMPDGSVR
jgi:hypothetical protein